MKNLYLTDAQRELAKSHMKIVDWVIYNHIELNAWTTGLTHDDLFQEGYEALCRAAATYNGSVQLKTYAQVVVRNALYSYCRYVSGHHALSLDVPMSDTRETFADFLPANDNRYDDSLSQSDTLKLLESVKLEYNGVVLKGIEALELKIKGFSGAEIAAMYGVKPTHVGAWISRAAEKLRKNERFLRAVT